MNIMKQSKRKEKSATADDDDDNDAKRAPKTHKKNEDEISMDWYKSL